MTSTRKFILTLTTWLLAVQNDSSCTSVKLHCFCTDSTKCPTAVCASHYGCYIDVKNHIPNTTHVQQKIIYGCTEEHNIKSCKKHEESSLREQTKNLPFCCSDDDMCNIPLLLKDIIERKRNQERTHRKRKQRKIANKQACPEVEPAIQLASVILPSILIAVVFFVSFLLFTELIRHRKSYICSKTLKEQIFWKNDSKYICDNQNKTSLKSLDLTSDSSSLTLSSML